METILRYVRLWIMLSVASFLTFFVTRWNVVIFLSGKLIRFALFILFLLILFRDIDRLAGFTVYEVLFFYFSFTLLDTVTQLLFREAYRFRDLIVSGDFDLVLTKPMSSLFRSLAGGADPLDFITLVPYVACLFYVGSRLPIADWTVVLWYLILLFNGFVIATAFHIIVLSLAIVTTEVDHTIMIYRDLTSMGRVPVDIYREPLRSLVTFVIPVGLMMTFPAKALLGLLSPLAILFSLALGFLFLVLSLRVWRFALSQYGSASS